MNALFSVIRLDLSESFRSKWFLGYSALFILLVMAIFASGVADSRVMGFTGLTRLLLIFIQACNIILPIFILITTVRTISKDRDDNVFEYMLSFPISLRSYYWGKVFGRMVVILVPLIVAMALILVIGLLKGSELPWQLMLLYTGLLISAAVVFLGIGFLISTLVRSQEMALGVAFFVWLFLIAFIDIALIGFMIKQVIAEEIVFSVALLNPIQVFRVGAIALFDPVLSVIGPAAYYILEMFGHTGFVIYALLYPIVLGAITLLLGYWFFKRKDLV